MRWKGRPEVEYSMIYLYLRTLPFNCCNIELYIELFLSNIIFKFKISDNDTYSLCNNECETILQMFLGVKRY
jgi:hypothetical protein